MKLKTLGLEINALTADVGKQLGMEDQTGVVITGVQDDSAAAASGLEPGMVIVQVNRQDVSSVEDFQRLVSADKDGSILFLIKTERGSSFVVVNQ